jgi:hypothetical protein
MNTFSESPRLLHQERVALEELLALYSLTRDTIYLQQAIMVLQQVLQIAWITLVQALHNLLGLAWIYVKLSMLNRMHSFSAMMLTLLKRRT